MKLTKIICFTAALLLFMTPCFSQEKQAETVSHKTETLEIETENPKQSEETNSDKHKIDKPFIVFDYGAAAAYVTRIQKQTNRSNFVFADTMVGLYFSAKTQKMPSFNLMARLAAYYPLYSTFNNVQQASKQTLLYGIDFTLAPVFEISMWGYAKIDLGLGMHFLYQLTDAWHYIGLGASPIAQIELPLAKRWSIILNGLGSLDFGNFGTNKDISPIDINYEYQVSLGARYSKKSPNSFSYIH